MDVEEAEETDKQMYISVELEVAKPFLEEVKEAVKRQRNEKAPVENRLTAELLKNGEQDFIGNLLKLIYDIWETEEMPEEWQSQLSHFQGRR